MFFVEYENKKDLVNVKIVLLGSYGVGKTTLAKMFIGDKGIRDESRRATIGADIYAVRKEYNIEPFGKIGIMWSIFELAGAYHFRKIHEDYYKDARAAIVMFDLCRRESLEDVSMWISDFIKNVGDDKPIVIVGNKADMRGITRCMSSSDAVAYIKKIKDAVTAPIRYIEISAINGINVEKVFEELATLLAEWIIKTKKQENKET